MTINNDGTEQRGRAPVVPLAAVAANGSGVFDFIETRSTFAMQVVLTGGANAGTVVATASLDGINFDTTALATFTIGVDASGVLKYVVDKPFRALKVTLAGLGGGGTVTAILAAA